MTFHTAVVDRLDQISDRVNANLNPTNQLASTSLPFHQITCLRVGSQKVVVLTLAMIARIDEEE